MTTRDAEATVLAIERPHPALWTYYLISSLAFLFLFPVAALVLWFKYHTLRYKFTAEGLSMSWGILFRRETIINYARIQDIHLRSNLIERWLGLGRILVQTASGNSGAEMTIEGIKEFELVRDFLYSRMRGVSEPAHVRPKEAHTVGADSPGLAEALLEVAREIRETRKILESRGAGAPKGTGDV
jgi:putative membrane protein